MDKEKTKIHHCFYCGEETDNFDELPNGSRIWVCGDNLCMRELSEIFRDIEAEARNKAEDDGFSRYY